MDDDTKITLTLTGPKVGGPSLDDVIALSKKLTGRDSTPEEIEDARKILAHCWETPTDTEAEIQEPTRTPEYK